MIQETENKGDGQEVEERSSASSTLNNNCWPRRLRDWHVPSERPFQGPDFDHTYHLGTGFVRIIPSSFLDMRRSKGSRGLRRSNELRGRRGGSLPRPLEGSTKWNPNSGLQNSYGVDYRTLRWINSSDISMYMCICVEPQVILGEFTRTLLGGPG